jgi:hypothetical protein
MILRKGDTADATLQFACMLKSSNMRGRTFTCNIGFARHSMLCRTSLQLHASIPLACNCDMKIVNLLLALRSCASGIGGTYTASAAKRGCSSHDPSRQPAICRLLMACIHFSMDRHARMSFGTTSDESHLIASLPPDSKISRYCKRRP